MTTTIQDQQASVGTEQVWRELAKASFAVISQVTPAGEPRSSGVLYRTIGRRLCVAVGADSWKARHIAANPRVAMTVPVRRGGILSLLAPIPPATISFHGTAIVHPADSPAARSLTEQLASLLPPERRASACIVEVIPEGAFLTYGLGVPLLRMRDPAASRGHAPVAQPGAVQAASDDGKEVTTWPSHAAWSG
jgi:Pyridoxamine 5'-phosphate oxidase